MRPPAWSSSGDGLPPAKGRVKHVLSLRISSSMPLQIQFLLAVKRGPIFSFLHMGDDTVGRRQNVPLRNGSTEHFAQSTWGRGRRLMRFLSYVKCGWPRTAPPLIPTSRKSNESCSPPTATINRNVKRRAWVYPGYKPSHPAEALSYLCVRSTEYGDNYQISCLGLGFDIFQIDPRSCVR